MAWHRYLGGRLSEYGHVWINVFLEHLHFVHSMVLIVLLMSAGCFYEHGCSVQSWQWFQR